MFADSIYPFDENGSPQQKSEESFIFKIFSPAFLAIPTKYSEEVVPVSSPEMTLLTQDSKSI